MDAEREAILGLLFTLELPASGTQAGPKTHKGNESQESEKTESDAFSNLRGYCNLSLIQACKTQTRVPNGVSWVDLSLLSYDQPSALRLNT